LGLALSLWNWRVGFKLLTQWRSRLVRWAPPSDTS
jgi:hypothetical protein